ncbi:hypothetical protein DFQ27_006924 [Actinomortierella ambigua]|uniref:Uncharacterized protein n=1 Tax=Actinomortierella ambigua TaxID=1343610 RepID=A0A9P6TZU8_9FUNG|nr:hypothetical protein DFQ27_006924 [Actinomortierella ambigua]
MQNDLHDSPDPTEGSRHIVDAASDDGDTHENEDISGDPSFENDVPSEVMQTVENMLRDLDMDEDIHRALRLLRPPLGFDAIGDDGRFGALDDNLESAVSNGHVIHHIVNHNTDSDEDQDDDNEDGAVAFGYIPLDQDDTTLLESSDDDDSDDPSEGRVAREADQDVEENGDNDAGQGFADYLMDKDGEAIVPTIPAGVTIDSVDAQDPIPEADLQTIQAIMQSFILPPSAVPDWARAIPEERWLPRISARQPPVEADVGAARASSP